MKRTITIALITIAVTLVTLNLLFPPKAKWLRADFQPEFPRIPPTGCFDKCYGIITNTICERLGHVHQGCTDSCFGLVYNKCNGIKLFELTISPSTSQ